MAIKSTLVKMVLSSKAEYFLPYAGFFKEKAKRDIYINENNITLVIDKKHMLGGNSEYDITKIIVENLNKELPSLNLK